MDILLDGEVELQHMEAGPRRRGGVEQQHVPSKEEEAQVRPEEAPVTEEE